LCPFIAFVERQSIDNIGGSEAVSLAPIFIFYGGQRSDEKNTRLIIHGPTCVGQRRAVALSGGNSEEEVREREMICLRLDRLPFWMGTIQTGRIPDESKRTRIVQFQRDFADVAWAAFRRKSCQTIC